MSEFFKPEKYNQELQASVEARKKLPIIDVEVIKKKNDEGDKEEVSVIDIAGVKMESLASKEDILEILKEIHPTVESLELLQSMA